MNGTDRVLLGQTGSDFFKHFDLYQLLGSGKFGDVHLCIEKATGAKYACKMIEKNKLTSNEEIDHIRTEIKIMRKLRGNPNIIQLKGTYEESQKVYMVMELCEGGELHDKIVEMHSCYNENFHEDHVAAIFKDIMQGVKVCHENGIIHRDLKPENMLYSTKEKKEPIKIIDFGYSTFFTRGQRFSLPVGTARYMAPEILSGYGKEIDIWSIGMIFYALLAGRTPFCGHNLNEMEILKEVISGREGVISFEGGIWNKISSEAKDLAKGMLTRDPKKRFTVQQILGHPFLVKNRGKQEQCISVAKPNPTYTNPDPIRRTRPTRIDPTLIRMNFSTKSN